MSKKTILIIVVLITLGSAGYGFFRYLNANPQEIKEETMTIKVYFNNSRMNINSADCSKVFPLDRTIAKTLGVGKASLEELFKGPTDEEKSQGYVSWFSKKTSEILKSIKIEDGTAYVDLLDIRQLMPNVSASCGSAQFLAEVETTLKQFDSIKKVIIAIEGKPLTFYEWIQIGCTKENNYCDETPFGSGNDAEEQAKGKVSGVSQETILAIKNKDANKLAGIAHPEKGVRFSPYQHVDTEKDVVFSSSQLLKFFVSSEKRSWGNYDGSGEPINMVPSDYYNKFIYDVDFSSAPEVSYNRIIGQGNIINNISESYPGSIVVEYHFAGFDPQYEGMDWRSLHLVYEEKNSRWYLTGIVHGQWTI